MLREQTALRTDTLTYYAQPGPLTDPHDQVHLFDGLPADVPSLVKVVQGVLVHIFWAERYGLQLSDERKQEVNLRFVDKMLRRIRELDDRALTLPREWDRKLVGNCRDHTTLLCAILRQQGVPARGRCGFGTYFLPNHYEDHWVAEYWSVDQQRWIMVDAQLDQLQQDQLQITFDPLDVPPDQFIVAGRAWQLIRSGAADPERFGIFDWHGRWFVQDNLVRDFLALNKIELLPWDSWGLMAGPDDCVPTSDLNLLDRMAALTLGGNATFDEVRALYESDPRLHTRPTWWTQPESAGQVK